MEQTAAPSNPPATQPHVVLVVIYSLAVLSLLGLIGTFILVRDKIDGSAIAVFSGLTGMVIGSLTSSLNNTRTVQGGQAGPVSEISQTSPADIGRPSRPFTPSGLTPGGQIDTPTP